MNEEEVYLEVNKSSEKRGMYFVNFLNGPRGRQCGFLSHAGKKCTDLDRGLTGDDELGTYFNSEDEALECISKFYIVEKKVD